MNKTKVNPYQNEIIATYILAPILVKVLTVKALMYLIVLGMCWRAFQLLLTTKFNV